MALAFSASSRSCGTRAGLDRSRPVRLSARAPLGLTPVSAFVTSSSRSRRRPSSRASRRSAIVAVGSTTRRLHRRRRPPASRSAQASLNDVPTILQGAIPAAQWPRAPSCRARSRAFAGHPVSSTLDGPRRRDAVRRPVMPPRATSGRRRRCRSRSASPSLLMRFPTSASCASSRARAPKPVWAARSGSRSGPQARRGGSPRDPPLRLRARPRSRCSQKLRRELAASLHVDADADDERLDACTRDRRLDGIRRSCGRRVDVVGPLHLHGVVTGLAERPRHRVAPARPARARAAARPAHGMRSKGERRFSPGGDSQRRPTVARALRSACPRSTAEPCGDPLDARLGIVVRRSGGRESEPARHAARRTGLEVVASPVRRDEIERDVGGGSGVRDAPTLIASTPAFASSVTRSR